MQYRDAGVDIAAAIRAKNRIKQLARTTFTPRVLRDVGAFGGFFSLAGLPRDAVLISSVDGVGTKLKLAFALGRHESVGADIVNHCVNDIAVHGARPLFFLDYLATGRLRQNVIEAIVRGIARACRLAGCALIGGETAEMPGFYSPGEYDLAGTIVGWVRKSRILDGHRIRPGNVIFGLPSFGLHTNGYSLARKVLLDQARIPLTRREPDLGRSLGDELLAPHRSYGPALAPLLERRLLRGVVHITGGGITENTPRILPRNCTAEIYLGSWPVLPIFQMIERLGRVSRAEMLRTFNMGLGLLLIVAKSDADRVAASLKRAREPFWPVGRIIAGRQEVKYVQP